MNVNFLSAFALCYRSFREHLVCSSPSFSCSFRGFYALPRSYLPFPRSEGVILNVGLSLCLDAHSSFDLVSDLSCCSRCLHHHSFDCSGSLSYSFPLGGDLV